ncbi:MAG: SRPBCC family protein [Ignavibacteriales bacterium]|nr:SRPBCC family protein [Ignavibacteriales bacterium]
MRTISTVVINKPVKDVWKFFDDPDNMQLWLTGFKRFEHISGTTGKPGAVSKHYYEMNGRSIEMTETITVRKEFEEFSGTMTNQWMVSSLTTTFRDLGNGSTEMKSNVESTFTPFFLKLFGPLMMKKGFQKRQDEDLDRLKIILERQ